MVRSEGHLRDEIVAKCCSAIEANKALLDELDQAIGDSDHGMNMSRGFVAARRAYDENRDVGFSTLCRSLGFALVMHVGGASGPLFGSMMLGFGALEGGFPRSAREVQAVFVAGIDAVKRRGKSDVGEKTMLDVLVPVCDVLGHENVSVQTIRECAARSLGRTRDMVATKGRSAFLGERSIGHIDPGAQSCCLLINAICDAVECFHER